MIDTMLYFVFNFVHCCITYCNFKELKTNYHPISAAETVSRLLGCTIEDLNLALSKRHMKVNNENIVQKLTLTQVSMFSH
jgi:hypothetical protein